jgi:hypothetical protein
MKARAKGLLVFVQGGTTFGKPVHSGLGRVHYKGLRVIGTTGGNPADAMAKIPATGEIRKGDNIHVVGAGGPMGVMHVIRNLCQGVPGVTVYAADLSDERLATLSRTAEPCAKANRVGYVAYNSTKTTVDAAFGYSAIMAPVPALINDAVKRADKGGVINIFAGIPAEKFGDIDMDAYVEKGLYFIGTSGSVMSDMRVVLAKVESGRLDTNVSVAAVAGLDGAVAGIQAVEKALVPGKIMVYPACKGLTLTPLSELKDKMPEVAAALKNQVWTREAEAALLARFGA